MWPTWRRLRAGSAAAAAGADRQTQTTASTTSAASTVVSGVQNTIAIIANFTDATVAPTPSQIHDILFSDPNGNSIDALFRETSFGNVGFSGQVAGPFVINFPPRPRATCELGGCRGFRRTAAGVNLASYPRASHQRA